MRYPCDQCKYAATTTTDLKRHKKYKHEGLGHPCDQCEHTAFSAGHLKKHVENKHEGVRYPCDQCMHASKGSLKSHKMRNHNN